jgi:hypothetical protein
MNEQHDSTLGEVAPRPDLAQPPRKTRGRRLLACVAALALLGTLSAASVSVDIQPAEASHLGYRVEVTGTTKSQAWACFLPYGGSDWGCVQANGIGGARGMFKAYVDAGHYYYVQIRWQQPGSCVAWYRNVGWLNTTANYQYPYALLPNEGSYWAC